MNSDADYARPADPGPPLDVVQGVWVVDGTLKNATIEPAWGGGKVVVGDLYNDRKQRFRDGTNVTTSVIVEWIEPSVVRTKNSIYRVELNTLAIQTYSTLREANQARQKEWDAGAQIDAAYRGNELAGEVGEACNIIKKLERERRGIKGSRASVDQLEDELADVIICVDLIAMGYGIDLDRAVARKFNATSEKVGLSVRLDTGSAAD